MHGQGAKLLFEQLEEVDPALHRSLEWLMNEPDSTKMLETFFSVTEHFLQADCDPTTGTGARRASRRSD